MGSALVQNSKINCLMALWRCQRLHWNWYDLIFLQKIFISLNSITENLIVAFTIGKTMCICEIYFSQIGVYLAHFLEEIQWKPQTFSGASPQTPLGLSWIRWGARSPPPPPKPPTDYSDISTLNFLKAVFRKFYLVHSWIAWPILWLTGFKSSTTWM